MNKYAIIGNPVQHSLSPIIHQLFAQQTQQQLTYDRILVEPNGLKQAILDFKAQGGKGLNITAPFKQEAFSLIKTCSERAHIAQAINTICFHEDGTWFGDNTDGVGLVRDIVINHRVSMTGKRLLIIGAGGAVRGVLPAILQQKPSEITIVNWTESKAFLLAKEFSIRAASFSDLNHPFDLVINGTQASAFSWLALNKNIYCYDMVYRQSGLTPFLQYARQNGVISFHDGLGMLIEQAAESFYLWRKIKPNTEGLSCILKDH